MCSTGTIDEARRLPYGTSVGKDTARCCADQALCCACQMLFPALAGCWAYLAGSILTLSWRERMSPLFCAGQGILLLFRSWREKRQHCRRLDAALNEMADTIDA